MAASQSKSILGSSLGIRLAGWLRKEWGLLAALAVFVLFPFIFGVLTGTSPTEGANRFWQGLLIQFFIMAVYAMSYDLLMGYIGILSFGQAAFFGGGAYAMGLFLKHVAPGISAKYIVTFPGLGNITDFVLLVIGFLLAVLVSGLLGLLFSALSARVKGVYFAMITLAAAEAIHILSKASDFVQYTGADDGLVGVPVPDWLNPTQNRLFFYFLSLVFLVVIFMVLQRIVNSPTGHIFLAIRENETRVQAVGYNPALYRSLAFVISGIVAGLAGAFYCLWNQSANPSMTDSLNTINALIMTILGGVGTLIGPVLGAGLMQIIGQFFDQWFGPRWPLVFGVVFIGLVLFLPYGIVGTWRLRRFNWKDGWQKLAGLLK
ncbi:MAG TPA: branched-chain amino acid ABC transporter permease [Anaerolineaceae bacterium]